MPDLRSEIRNHVRLSLTGATESESVESEVLLVAGVTNASVPLVFRRRGKALTCLDRLVARPSFATLDNPTQALVHAWLSVLTRDQRPDRSAMHRATAYRLDRQAADSVLRKK